METIKTRCLIIGSGPAGYTAAIYTSRANIGPLVIEGYQPGGQLTITTDVENFPGYPEGVSGPQLMDDLRAQAVRFGADIRSDYVSEVDFSSRPFIARTEKLEKKVAVGGGGDTACEEALYLSNLASEVYLIVRKDHLRASKVMQHRVLDKENIHVLFNTNTVGLYGAEFVEGAHLVEHVGTDNERRYDLPIDGFFLAIGHKPNTEVFGEFITLDHTGYIKVEGAGTATNIHGVFAAGDVADPTYRQAVTAAGMGCKAALDVERFLSEQA